MSPAALTLTDFTLTHCSQCSVQCAAQQGLKQYKIHRHTLLQVCFIHTAQR